MRVCLSKEVVEEGRPPREREGTCETRPRGTKNDDGMGRLNDRRFGTGAREVPGMRMQDKESNGGPKKKGGGRRHLGFGTSMPDATGTRTGASGMDGREAPMDVGGTTTTHQRRRNDRADG